MAFNSVPWAVGAGAQLDASVARTFTNIATQDTEGINLPGDFKVTALPTAGPQVQIAGGGMTIRNAQQPGESYVGASTATTTVNVSANNSGATRHDLVIARVIDPDFSPWQPYTDPQAILTGPYFEPFVVSGVSATCQTALDAGITYSAVALARLDLPNGTTNVTSSMITDVRQLARARESRVVGMKYPTKNVQLTSTSFVAFPDSTFSVSVPYWATHVFMTVTIASITVAGGDTWGQWRALFGSITGAGMNYDFNVPSNDPASQTMVATVDADVTSLQGQTVTVSTQAERYDPTQIPSITGYLETTDSTQVIVDCQFYERPS